MLENILDSLWAPSDSMCTSCHDWSVYLKLWTGHSSLFRLLSMTFADLDAFICADIKVCPEFSIWDNFHWCNLLQKWHKCTKNSLLFSFKMPTVNMNLLVAEVWFYQLRRNEEVQPDHPAASTHTSFRWLQTTGTFDVSFPFGILKITWNELFTTKVFCYWLDCITFTFIVPQNISCFLSVLFVSVSGRSCSATSSQLTAVVFSPLLPLLLLQGSKHTSRQSELYVICFIL